MRVKKQNHEQQLLIVAGLIAGFISLAQWNIQEVLRVDRFQHMSLSALFLIITFYLMPNRPLRFIAPIFIVLGLGLLKEIYDPIFCDLDFMADFVGVILGGMLLMAMTPLKKLSKA